MINLTFYAVPSFFRHQKDSGSWSIHKGENFSNESCILAVLLGYETIIWHHQSQNLGFFQVLIRAHCGTIDVKLPTISKTILIIYQFDLTKKFKKCLNFIWFPTIKVWLKPQYVLQLRNLHQGDLGRFFSADNLGQVGEIFSSISYCNSTS